jgi:uncharacterized protein (TIGR02646 family)
MRAIPKNNEPASLAQHRCQHHADYNNYADKDTLRQSLVTEQRGLCCYCLSRIRPVAEETKIEHWHCQDSYPAEQLDYGNLLGACLGKQGQSSQRQHCDTLKGNRDLSRNPANPAHQVEQFIQFEGDGTITSNDLAFNTELNEVLNLNAKFLKNNRKAVLDAFKTTLLKRGDLPRPTLERWLRERNGETHAGDLEPFCQVVVYWLRKRLAPRGPR